MTVLHLVAMGLVIFFVVLATKNAHGSSSFLCLTFLPQLLPDGFATAVHPPPDAVSMEFGSKEGIEYVPLTRISAQV